MCLCRLYVVVCALHVYAWYVYWCVICLCGMCMICIMWHMCVVTWCIQCVVHVMCVYVVCIVQSVLVCSMVCVPVCKWCKWYGVCVYVMCVCGVHVVGCVYLAAFEQMTQLILYHRSQRKNNEIKEVKGQRHRDPHEDHTKDQRGQGLETQGFTFHSKGDMA